MLDKIKQIGEEFSEAIQKVTDSKELEEIRLKYLSRKGIFPQLFEDFKALPKEEKPAVGQLLNQVKNQTQNLFDEIKTKVELAGSHSDSYIDLTLPGRSKQLGSKHLLIQSMNEIKKIFIGLGFSVYEGPELESDYNNFEALNFPPDHPARDMQDTFFINDDFLLRTHTSPVQIRLMKNTKPPIRAIMPGKVYRNEAISAKSYCLFHQVEGLYIDTDVTFAELKGTLVSFVKRYFGDDVKYRFRASFFPFTEPSAELDIWWQPKDKPGQWMEILGCGMVDPNVLENVGIDPEKYVGYAFGMGVERSTLRKYKINDIRNFFDNDKRFLEQF
ncbi:MAG: phenylalanine--tRNA ligase subunit alpha [Melioribacteraceae bacterium]|nr:phenylalanine--tRNA ligase subunit alpha [Melioribacteraceae bacterium]MCF8354384.1 phenylalanine--tRNA ligase subunit alpha [Melioribacteraceae bacterium]MCF8396216.1 phenylalanine--tRNA ligase subunit alpha [Melioribacteraceae bacterium]MCF8417238.1 phenylalanine--tRNA ligase subunit alpha [Melioribacteraceae bacterium]